MEPEKSEDSHTVNALMREHAELVDLIIHEDSLTWQLRAGYLTINGTLLAVTYFLGAFNIETRSLGAVGLVQTGAIAYNIVSFFIFERMQPRLSSRYLRAYEIEDQLEAEFGVKLKTLSTAERRIDEGQTLDAKYIGNLRRLHWYERLDFLRMGPWSLMIAGFWILLLIWILLERPFLP